MSTMKPANPDTQYSYNLERTQFLLEKCEESLKAYRAEKRQLDRALDHGLTRGVEAFSDDVRSDLAALRMEFNRVLESWGSMTKIVEEQKRNAIGIGNEETRDEVLRRILEIGGMLNVDTSKVWSEF